VVLHTDLAPACFMFQFAFACVMDIPSMLAPVGWLNCPARVFQPVRFGRLSWLTWKCVWYAAWSGATHTRERAVPLHLAAETGHSGPDEAPQWWVVCLMLSSMVLGVTVNTASLLVIQSRSSLFMKSLV
jgi:hypothetical protein